MVTGCAEVSGSDVWRRAVRRLVARELGAGAAARAGGPGGAALFPARMLAGLQLQRRTLGHLSAVYCLVFDCTGRYVCTGADDMLVKVPILILITYSSICWIAC